MVLVLAALAPMPASAECGTPEEAGTGVLYLHGADGTWAPALALETDVALQVSGIVARARVVQRFANPSDEWLEAVYVFPLPEGAAVDRLDMRIGDRWIEGEIQERERARKSYAAAAKEGRKASLLEQQRPNLFTTRLANLAPGEEVEVAIEYQETLRYEEGRFRLRFPMVAPPRHMPGGAEPATLAGARPGAIRLVETSAALHPPYLHPDADAVNPVRLRVDLEPGFPLAGLFSPTHIVEAKSLGDGRHQVYLEDRADRDLVLEWRPRAGAEPSAALFSEERGGEIHALLLVMPPQVEALPRRFAREVVFVIDTSGSMSGASIEQAKRALVLALERLAPGDSFNLVRFASRAEALFDASVPADAAHLERARRWILGLEAGGGTEMLSALEAAFANDRGAGDLRQVVFVTDGSIGNEEQLFSTIDRGLGRSRLFPVGIGAAPNGFFLTRAAKLGRGSLTLIATPAEVDERMNELFRKLETPLLSDIEVQWNDDVEMWPARVPDLYAGEPVVLTARLPRFVGEVVVSGRRGGHPWELRLPLRPGGEAPGVGALWARRKIEALMERRITGGDPEAVRSEVVEVAMRHHLVSRYTSLVAVERVAERPKSDPLRTSSVAAHLPAGMVAAQVGVLPRTATPALLYQVLGLAVLLLGLVVARRPA